MIRAFLQLALGTIGRALLNLYRTYSLPINSIVVAYGILTLYAHNNLRAVIREMEAMMLDVASGLGEKPDPHHLLSQFSQRWRAEQGERRLFLPNRLDLWFGSVATAELIGLLLIGPDYVRIALHRHTGWPAKKSFHPVDYRVWEEYRHRLLIGVRTKLPDIKALKVRYKEQRKDKERKAKEKGRK
jgi:hypothetical protein